MIHFKYLSGELAPRPPRLQCSCCPVHCPIVARPSDEELRQLKLRAQTKDVLYDKQLAFTLPPKVKAVSSKQPIKPTSYAVAVGKKSPEANLQPQLPKKESLLEKAMAPANVPEAVPKDSIGPKPSDESVKVLSPAPKLSLKPSSSSVRPLRSLETPSPGALRSAMSTMKSSKPETPRKIPNAKLSGMCATMSTVCD